jgi:hypothetical protein
MKIKKRKLYLGRFSPPRPSNLLSRRPRGHRGLACRAHVPVSILHIPRVDPVTVRAPHRARRHEYVVPMAEIFSQLPNVGTPTNSADLPGVRLAVAANPLLLCI